MLDLALEEAAKDRDVEEVKRLLSRGADPNGAGSNGKPLFRCIVNGDVEIANILLSEGANPCLWYPQDSHLDHAIRQRNLQMVKLLLENGAKFILHDGLVRAIESRDLKMVRGLIDLEANVNRPSSSQESPLMCAVRMRNYEILKALHKSGANLNVTDCNGDTPLIASVRNMHLPIVRYLVAAKADLDKKNAKEETALSISLLKNDFRTFRLLMKSGANPTLALTAIELKMESNSDLRAFMSSYGFSLQTNKPTVHVENCNMQPSLNTRFINFRRFHMP